MKAVIRILFTFLAASFFLAAPACHNDQKVADQHQRMLDEEED